MINGKIPHDFGTPVSQWLGLDLWTYVNIYGKYNGNTMKYNSMKHHEIFFRVKNCPSSKCMVCIVLSILDTVALWTPSNPWLFYHVVPQYPHSIPWYSQYSHFFMGFVRYVGAPILSSYQNLRAGFSSWAAGCPCGTRKNQHGSWL